MNSFQQQLDELGPKRKDLVDSTRLEEERQKKELAFRMKMERISKHSTEETKMGVRFLTKWVVQHARGARPRL